MRRRRPSRPARQLGLFHPQIDLPRWETLSTRTRRTVMPLLVELLKTAALPTARQVDNEECEDE